MVKHTQTIRRQQPTNCLSLFDHFVGLALKGLPPFDTWDCYYFESNLSPILQIKVLLMKKACIVL